MSGWEHEVDERTVTWLDLHAHEIVEVVKHTARDATGIAYKVLARTASTQRTIWERYMRFGAAAHLRPGGHNCEINALIQDDCANTIWERKNASTTALGPSHD